MSIVLGLARLLVHRRRTEAGGFWDVGRCE